MLVSIHLIIQYAFLSLTDDKFEGIVTVVYPDADAISVESALQSNIFLKSSANI